MIEYKYSTFWPRFCAGIVDCIVFAPLGYLYSFTFEHSESISIRVAACVINSAAYLVYSIWMHGKFGQTLGKMVCKVIVRDLSERPLKMKQAVLRDIVGVIMLPIGLAIDIPQIFQGIDVSTPESLTTIQWIVGYSALVWFLIEIITMLTNNKRRAVHDFIAGTVVTRTPND